MRDPQVVGHIGPVPDEFQAASDNEIQALDRALFLLAYKRDELLHGPGAA